MTLPAFRRLNALYMRVLRKIACCSRYDRSCILTDASVRGCLKQPSLQCMILKARLRLFTKIVSENHGNIGRGAGGIKKVARNGSVYAGFKEPEGGRDGRGMQKDTRERISGKGPSTLGLMECKK